MKNLLYFVYVWPEATSSAAGVRCEELLNFFQQRGWKITLASSCAENVFSERFRAQGFSTLALQLNDTSGDESLKAVGPDLVLFDRFVMEEQFGWKVREFFPDVPTVIDTQDLHFLRRNREELHRKRDEYLGDELLDSANLLQGETFQREIASFLRSDGVLILSRWEMDLLECNLPFLKSKLCWFPLLSQEEPPPLPIFEDREDICFLGNYRHGPNLDGFQWFVESIWKKLPSRPCRLFTYGAYPAKYVSDLHGKFDIHFVGAVDDHREKLKSHRLLVAPLRYGAGMKGKVLEAWNCGTPVIGTPIAFEGMWLAPQTAPVFFDLASFTENFKKLYEEKSPWKSAQLSAKLAAKQFSLVLHRDRLDSFLAPRLADIKLLRQKDHLGKILNAQSLNSMKYLSRWIECKNRK